MLVRLKQYFLIGSISSSHWLHSPRSICPRYFLSFTANAQPLESSSRNFPVPRQFMEVFSSETGRVAEAIKQMAAHPVVPEWMKCVPVLNGNANMDFVSVGQWLFGSAKIHSLSPVSTCGMGYISWTQQQERWTDNTTLSYYHAGPERQCLTS